MTPRPTASLPQNNIPQADPIRRKQLSRRGKERSRLPETMRREQSPRGKKKATPQIELFQKEECAHSHQVRRRLSELGIDFIARSVPEGQELKHKELVDAGGKDRVPFLVDHRTGVHLYESDTILDYLDSEYGEERSMGRVSRAFRFVEGSLRGRADRLSWLARRPLDQASELSRAAREALVTLRGTARMLRSMVEGVVSDFRSKRGSGEEMAGETPEPTADAKDDATEAEASAEIRKAANG